MTFLRSNYVQANLFLIYLFSLCDSLINDGVIGNLAAALQWAKQIAQLSRGFRKRAKLS